MRRAVALVCVAVLAAGGLAACSRPGDGGYELIANFPRAVALYPDSLVKVMGFDVGHVTAIKVVNDHVEVRMRIDRDVPLPTDVNAAIVPLSLIGERNVVLSPPWHTGLAKIADGATIPPERTHVPVEPDEALQAVTDLARAVDPDAVKSVVTNGAAALKGRGADLNEALRQAGDLVALIAAQDHDLLATAADVHTLALTLQSRQAVLGKLLDDFAAVSSAFAEERSAIATILRSLASLTEEGKALITKYQVQLPQDLASLARVALTVQVNADSVQQLVHALDDIGNGVVGAYDPQTGGVRIRFTGSPTTMLALQPIFALLGLGAPPCVPVGDVQCP